MSCAHTNIGLLRCPVCRCGYVQCALCNAQ